MKSCSHVDILRDRNFVGLDDPPPRMRQPIRSLSHEVTVGASLADGRCTLQKGVGEQRPYILLVAAPPRQVIRGQSARGKLKVERCRLDAERCRQL